MRLNKILVILKITNSRRKADLIIKNGEIKDTSGKVLSPNYQSQQAVALVYRGKTYQFEPNNPELTKIILLNKPIGYTCSHVNQNDFTIFNLLPAEYQNFKIGGRLDKNSSGLVLLSNDGNFINDLIHPSLKKIKSYQVVIDQKLDKKDEKILLHGIELAGKTAKFFAIKYLGNYCYEIQLITGLNQQIRKSFALLKYQVISIHRIRIGKFQLGNLATGEFSLFKEKYPLA